MKSVILLSNYVQDVEFTYPYYRLQEEGEVEYAPSSFDGTVGINGQDMWKIVKYGQQAYFPSSAEDCDLLVIPGGATALEYMRQDKVFIDYVREVNARRKTIATICHGSQMLIEADILTNRKVLGYYSIRKDLENAGGIWAGDDKPYVVDGNIVSCAHYKHMAAWLKSAIDLVNSK